MSCAHRQAEPVVLSTGEQVACVCITCYAALPTGYIDGQYRRAERTAHCKHEDSMDFSTFGEIPGSRRQCIACGVSLA